VNVFQEAWCLSTSRNSATSSRKPERFSRAQTQNTAEMIKMLGLGQGAQRLLEALRRPMSGRELARDLKITKQRVHQLVVKLHGMGHVRLATRRGFCTSSHSADPNRSGKG